MRFSPILALASVAAAQLRGFNYGANDNTGAARTQQDFEDEFNRAKSLQGTSGFTSARLYTMIQAGTADTATSAIQAAINTQTQLLLGLWASAGQGAFTNEVTALKNAISQYGTSFTDLIVGISVGSEDLYRVSPTGIENNSGAGSTPDALVSYISQVRDAIRGTHASAASVGHVDTWTAWVNGSNAAVINAVDWLGMDGYPYYETTVANSIANGENLFFESYNATVGVAGGKEVWVTETGWPVQGPSAGQAVPSVQNAETYWQDVACRLLGNVNTFWFTLYDPQASGAVSFSVVGPNLDSAPLYDLSCKNGNNQASSSSAAAKPSTSAAAPTHPTTVAKSSQTYSIVTSPGVESSAPASAVSHGPVSAESSPAAMTTGAAAPSYSAPAGGETYTVYSTTLMTITSCKYNECSETVMPTHAPASQGGAQPVTQMSDGQVAAPASTVPAAATSAAPSGNGGKNCPTSLEGSYEYPHLIVPVNSVSPDQAYGTSYNGTISPMISSIFNFDIPASDAGKTCSLIFLLPEQKDLQTSSFTFNGKGGIEVNELSSPATEATTYSNAPAKSGLSQEISSVQPGNEYLVFSHECGAGQRVAFEFSSTGGLELNYFQDYNPSPIGAYITVC